MPDMLFKVLSASGRSCHGGSLQWPLPTQRPDGTWAPGEAVRVEGPLVPCENGIHLATARQVVEHWMGARIWVAQWRGELVDAGDKWVARDVRLLHPTAWDDRTARHFACDCAERALRRVTRADARSWAAIHAARRFADGKATDRERGAAESAAWNAARSAAWIAARNAAWNAARSAAWIAARNAAWNAARSAERSAERDWQASRLLHYLQGGQPPCSA